MQEESGHKEGNQININGQLVLPGESSIIKLNVGRLPSDTRIYVHLHVFNSKKPGPVMLILGGVHGDEINGVEIVRRSLEQNLFKSLDCGTVIAIPLLNVFGFINFSRDVPDGKDVNRSFPGSLTGSLASRVARLLTKNVLPSVDLIVDFHTGGASRYNYPQVRCTKGDFVSFELAKIFNPPFIIFRPIISKSLRKVAKTKKMPILVFEGGEALRLDGFTINRGMLGLERLLVAQKMINKLLPPRTRTVQIDKASWIRAGASGIFTWNKSAGASVKKGEPIGIINDPNGIKRVVVQANKSGFIIGHNNAPVVNQGDALFNIGYAFKEVENEDLD